jgi:hypothetical protein
MIIFCFFFCGFVHLFVRFSQGYMRGKGGKKFGIWRVSFTQMFLVVALPLSFLSPLMSEFNPIKRPWYNSRVTHHRPVRTQPRVWRRYYNFFPFYPFAIFFLSSIALAFTHFFSPHPPLFTPTSTHILILPPATLTKVGTNFFGEYPKEFRHTRSPRLLVTSHHKLIFPSFPFLFFKLGKGFKL